MNRKTKNIIMIVVAVLLAAGMALSVSFASKQSAMPSGRPDTQMSSGGQNSNSQNSGDQAQPPAMPGDSNDSGNSSNNSGGQNSNSQNSGDQGQPPAMPGDSKDSGNSSNNSGDQNSSDQAQPPAMPGDSNDSGNSGNNSDDQNSGDQGQPPAMPGDSNDSGAPNSSGDQGGSHGSAPTDNMTGGHPGGKIGSGLGGGFYALFGAQALAFALIVLYLIFSKMNSRSIRATFRNRDRIVAFVLAVILVAGCLMQAEAGVSRYLLDSQGGNKQMEQPGGQMQGGSEANTEAAGATTVDGKEETLNDTYESSEADENAILVTGGGKLTSDGATINKKSGDSSNTGSSDFSGVNSALLVNDNSTATVKNAKISTSAKGANAVFATGENSKISISDSTITTTGEASSRGLDATYDGTIEASKVKITTQGGSCAAMATDRGEGTVSATDSTMETNGAGSPVIYSTGNITLSNSTGKANGAQIAVVEGKNSAIIEDSTVTCSAAGNRGDVDVAGVMVYQSMSGDAGEGTGNFTATDSDLSIDKNSKYYKTAPMFFVTNTSAVIKLTDTKLDFGSGTLLSAMGTSEWGNEGSNGGEVTLDAAEQTLKGNIELDKLSSLTMKLSDGSTYTGTINGDKSAKSVALSLDKSSKIKLTGDSYVSSLDNADASNINIDFNGHKLYVDGKAIN